MRGGSPGRPVPPVYVQLEVQEAALLTSEEGAIESRRQRPASLLCGLGARLGTGARRVLASILTCGHSPRPHHPRGKSSHFSRAASFPRVCSGNISLPALRCSWSLLGVGQHSWGKWSQTVVLVPTSYCCVGPEPTGMSSEGPQTELDVASLLGMCL